jgi:hypothetical protein
MQEDQLRDVLDHLLGVLQRPQPLAGHLRADDLVVVEAHPAVGFEAPRGRLADVVKQRRPAQYQVRATGRIFQIDGLAKHRQRMPVDVLVLMVFVDGHAHTADLRQHHVAESGLHHQVDTRHRVGAQQQLVQFRGDPLGGDAGQLRRHLRHRGPHPRRDVEPELRGEPRGTQHAQRIVTEGHLGRRRGVEHFRPQRGQTA